MFAEFNILKTKIQIPLLKEDAFPRPDLVDTMNASLHKKLTLICAPPGFGKTTLAVSWLNQLQAKTSWVSLDPFDNDFLRFWRYVAASVDQHALENGGASANTPSGTGAHLYQTAAIFE